MDNFNELIEKSEIIISVGSGGVGKTTTSAAIALQAAIYGKKTIVLTIDPAKRLANSLGVEEITGEVEKINLENMGIKAKGELYAMMLDMKTAMDDMVKREASSEEYKKNIFENKIYKMFSTSLAGTQDFAAMEKLWEIWNKNEYDLIVLDTPPTSNAIDFLTFPQRIFDTFDNKITSLMISVYKKSGFFTFKFFSMGTQVLLKGISKFVGVETLDVLSSFLFHISDLIEGMKKRSKEVFDLLRKDKVNFVVVAAPNPVSLKEALFFKDELKKSNLNFYGFIINRYHLKFEGREIKTDEVTEILKNTGFFEGQSNYILEKFADKLINNLNQFNILSKIEDKHLEIIKNEKFIKIPFFEKDIYNLKGLLRVSKKIFDF